MDQRSIDTFKANNPEYYVSTARETNEQAEYEANWIESQEPDDIINEVDRACEDMKGSGIFDVPLKSLVGAICEPKELSASDLHSFKKYGSEGML